MSEKIIGILGGMGPEATADLYMRIIRATPAKRDQDHPRVIIYSNSKVPDRTAAIIGTGPSPLPELIRAGKPEQGMNVVRHDGESKAPGPVCSKLLAQHA